MGWSLKVLSNPDHSVTVLWKIILVPNRVLSELGVTVSIISQHKWVLFWQVKTGTDAFQGLIFWPKYQICNSV